MKETKIAIIAVLLFLIGAIINIFALINKEETKTPVKTTISATTTTETTTTSTSVPTTTKTTKKVIKTTKKVSSVNSYKITHYGADCRGCSGITASGFNAKKSIWYNDKEYGQIRVVATNKDFPLYSVIRLNNYGNGNVIAIVLDRGVGRGVIDVLVESEAKASKLGIKRNVTIDILRRGK